MDGVTLIITNHNGMVHHTSKFNPFLKQRIGCFLMKRPAGNAAHLIDRYIAAVRPKGCVGGGRQAGSAVMGIEQQ